ncbi:MAG TPA: hypothetical protein VLG38_03280 [Gammaproteobacteria bacterium]|nr:hypothetical protein [Gammaproteobacteria bacterium]
MPGTTYDEVSQLIKQRAYTDTRLILRDQGLTTKMAQDLINDIHAWPELEATLTELEISNVKEIDDPTADRSMIIVLEIGNFPALRQINLDDVGLVKLKLRNLPSLTAISARFNAKVLTKPGSVETNNIDINKITWLPYDLIQRPSSLTRTFKGTTFSVDNIDTTHSASNITDNTPSPKSSHSRKSNSLPSSMRNMELDQERAPSPTVTFSTPGQDVINRTPNRATTIDTDMQSDAATIDDQSACKRWFCCFR